MTEWNEAERLIVEYVRHADKSGMSGTDPVWNTLIEHGRKLIAEAEPKIMSAEYILEAAQALIAEQAARKAAEEVLEKIVTSDPEAYDECCGSGVQNHPEEPPECCAQPIRDNAARAIAREAIAAAKARRNGGG